MAREFDFVVFGSGFAGSIMSMVLKGLGYEVLLVEKGSHPRFAIGESSTPFANLLLEKLADEYELPILRSFSKWGTWQKHHPEVGCGLKRGFSFFHHTRGRPLDPFSAATQLLVAASPNDQVADTHWYRPEFDQFLVEMAQAEGVQYMDQTRLVNLQRENEWHIELARKEQARNIRASFILDALGPSNALGAFLGISESSFANFPETRSIYAHFRNVPQSLNELAGDRFAPPWPYPPEHAAIHHVFEDGWVWLLHFNNGVTSAGVMLLPEKAAEFGWGRDVPAQSWRKLLLEFPTLADIFQQAEPITPFYASARVAFRKSPTVGEGIALLPSAAGFVDPLLSTGFPLTLLGIRRLGAIFKKPSSEWRELLEKYGERTLIELEATADLVGALYASMQDFDRFRNLTLLYFAALSFTESSWRLGREDAASSFLLTNNARFSSSRAKICEDARERNHFSRETIAEAIAPFDIAGLCDKRRHPWYPVRIEDLYAGQEKLEVNHSDLDDMLVRCGLRASERP